jgi:DNA-binding NarL/FixJ family response regulator
MPKMNGLQLVTTIRRQHPGVPVILMTAFGSETLAIEALEQGAASYVPKAQLADRLANTIEKVLTLARADQNYEHLINRAADAEFTLVLKNDAALIDPLVDLVQQMAVGMNFCESTERLRIGMALKEALNNALFHGSLEISADRMQNVLDKVRQGEQVGLIQDPRSEPSYRDREITVRVRLSPDEVRFVVEDEGPGFDVTDLPISNDPAALEPGRGRGLTIMRNFMDEVLFNDTGNQVTMVKRREAN